MRELGFSEKWPKLKQDTFTTFRFQRRDRDWQVYSKGLAYTLSSAAERYPAASLILPKQLHALVIVGIIATLYDLDQHKLPSIKGLEDFTKNF